MDAIKLQRLSHRLYKAKVPVIPGLIYRFIHLKCSSCLSPAIQIGEGTKLGHGGIGVVVNQKAKIGRNVILAQNVTIASRDGCAPSIGDWCYVGANSVVLGGVKLGKNSYVGALSFVNKDVPDGAIVIGIPARVLRIRTQEEISEWHHWVIEHGGINIDE